MELVPELDYSHLLVLEMAATPRIRDVIAVSAWFLFDPGTELKSLAVVDVFRKWRRR